MWWWLSVGGQILEIGQNEDAKQRKPKHHHTARVLHSKWEAYFITTAVVWWDRLLFLRSYVFQSNTEVHQVC